MPEIKLYAIAIGIIIPIFIILIGVLARRIVAEKQSGWRDWVVGIELVGISVSFSAAMLLEMIGFHLGMLPKLTLSAVKYASFVFTLLLGILFLLTLVLQYQAHMREPPRAAVADNPHPLSLPRMLWINFVGAVPLAFVLWVLLS